MKKKSNKIKNNNQASFYFEDYLETNKKIKFLKQKDKFQDRIYLLFFLFASLILIFCIRITNVSLSKIVIQNSNNSSSKYIAQRRDIVDRNGVLISRNINTYDIGVKPQLVKDKKNFLIKLRINFPDLPIDKIKKKLNGDRFFYIKRKIDQKDKDKFRNFGDKGIIFEHSQRRIYTHGNLFSHIIGQVDSDNYGISGIEKFFDKELKNTKKITKPLKLTLESNIQHIINNELKESLKIFSATGAGALLMNVNNGDIISLVSLPNFDINKRQVIAHKKYMNKITKGVYELGSIFKTFTVALALENGLVSPETIINNIPQKLKCSKYQISDMKEHPRNLSVSEILVRSSNVGSVLLAREVGDKVFKKFIETTNLIKSPDLEIEETGVPHNIKWEQCKLETVSFGHGITTTPVQATSIYAAISNGGKIVKPSLVINRKKKDSKILISAETSKTMNSILRQVVSSKTGTAHLADIDGFYVGGKTGTAESYEDKKDRINTFISIFPTYKPQYALLVMLENPQINKELIYDYRGTKTKAPYNTSGWNSVYIAGKIIEKIGPILAINNGEFTDPYVVKKFN